jgi:hypothetical protein
VSTTINTTLDDMKTSLRLATKNILSYFLANLGMVIVVLILALIIAVPIAIVAIAFIAPLSEATLEALAVWAMANPLAVGTIALLVLIPIVSIFLTIEGSLYGMTHDLVTTSETKAESAFSYLRRKFLTFVGAGAILTIVIAVPPVVAWGLTSIAMGYTITPLASTVLTVFTFAWLFLTCGLTSMVWPAVVSGKGVQDSFKQSFSLATRHFDRVYGVISAIVLLIAVTFGPVVVWGIAQAPFMMPPVPPVFDLALGLIGAWTVVSAFLWLLIFLPMIKIVFVKVYQELTGGKVVLQKPVEVPIV